MRRHLLQDETLIGGSFAWSSILRPWICLEKKLQEVVKALTGSDFSW